MSKTIDTLKIADTTTNPAPLGLVGFGMTTVLFNLHNLGLFALDTMILAIGLFFGGLAQVVVGNQEWKKGNMFGMMAFSTYGYFWIILISLLIFPKLGLGTAPTPYSMGWLLVVFGVFTFGVWIATFSLNKFTCVLFGMVLLLFGFLAAADFTGNATLKLIGAIDGVICGSFALYIALGMVINDTFGKDIVPVH